MLPLTTIVPLPFMSCIGKIILTAPNELVDISKVANNIANIVANYFKENLSKAMVQFYKSIDFDKYPEYFGLKYHNYAFKSACIWETMHMMSSDNLFWLDAGCGIKNELKAIRILLRVFGFYSPFSSTSVGDLTYPAVLNEFDPMGANGFGKKRMLSGGVVGLNIRNNDATQIIREWHQLTYRQDLLAPEGSNRDNHRQDQSLLSLVYYSRKRNVPILERRYYEFMVHLNKR